MDHLHRMHVLSFGYAIDRRWPVRLDRQDAQTFARRRVLRDFHAQSWTQLSERVSSRLIPGRSMCLGRPRP
jgi:hypothetical protein